MKKIFLMLGVALGLMTLSACASKMYDYAGDVTLDQSKYANKSFLTDGIGEVSLYRTVDGDTAHFTDGDSASFSVRFLGVDTPESTGKIEEWGKGASNFTADKLNNATTIVLESNEDSTSTDSNGRYLAWVWVDGRLLNLELVQEGYSKYGSVTGSPYAELMLAADLQAQELSLRIWSDEEDPDYYYGEAEEVTLKDLRENIEDYNGKKVTFTGIVYRSIDNDGYIQAEYNDKYYGIFIFSQYNSSVGSVLLPGNELQVTGQVAYYEPTAGTGSYQIVDVKYSTVSLLKSDDDIVVLSKNNEVVATEVSLPDFDLEKNPYIERTYVQINNITAITTGSYTSSAGHMTVICQDSSGNNIQLYIRGDRNIQFNGVKLTSYTQLVSYGEFNIRGIVSQYNGKFQLEITSTNDFIDFVTT